MAGSGAHPKICEIVEVMLRHGADANATYVSNVTPMSYTPLLLAVTAGSQELVDLLLRHGAHPEGLAIQTALALGHTEIWKTLRRGEKGRKVRGQGEERRKGAAGEGKGAAGEGKGAAQQRSADSASTHSVSAGSATSSAPAPAPAPSGPSSMASQAEAPSAAAPAGLSQGGYTLLEAIGRGSDSREVAPLITPASLTQRAGPHDATALHLAAGLGQVQTVELLLREGAEVNARSNVNATALHLAARLGHKGIARLLLQHDAALDERNTSQSTPLHTAAQHGHAELTEILLDAGADINARGVCDLTPLHYACAAGQQDVAELLVARGAKLHLAACPPADALPPGMVLPPLTPLDSAFMSGHMELARMLQAHGASGVLAQHAAASTGEARRGSHNTRKRPGPKGCAPGPTQAAGRMAPSGSKHGAAAAEAEAGPGHAAQRASDSEAEAVDAAEAAEVEEEEMEGLAEFLRGGLPDLGGAPLDQPEAAPERSAPPLTAAPGVGDDGNSRAPREGGPVLGVAIKAGCTELLEPLQVATAEEAKKTSKRAVKKAKGKRKARQSGAAHLGEAEDKRDLSEPLPQAEMQDTSLTQATTEDTLVPETTAEVSQGAEATAHAKPTPEAKADVNPAPEAPAEREAVKAEVLVEALPVATIEKIMRSDEEVRGVSAEVLGMVAVAAELFIKELTQVAWGSLRDSRQSGVLLRRSHIAAVVAESGKAEVGGQVDYFDFLADLVDDRLPASTALVATVRAPGSTARGAARCTAAARAAAAPLTSSDPVVTTTGDAPSSDLPAPASHGMAARPAGRAAVESGAQAARPAGQVAVVSGAQAAAVAKGASAPKPVDPKSRSGAGQPAQRTAAVSEELTDALCEAVFDGNLVGARALLERGGADARAATSMGITPLSLVARTGRAELVHLLVKHGADVEDPDFFARFGVSVLHSAAKEGSHHVVRALVESGADLEARDDEGSTALHKTAEGGSAETSRTLIRMGADVHALNGTKHSVLHLAASLGHVAQARVLLESGADLHAVGRVGETPLHCAASRGQLEMVRVLVGLGADHQRRCHSGRTAGRVASSATVREYLQSCAEGMRDGRAGQQQLNAGDSSKCPLPSPPTSASKGVRDRPVDLSLVLGLAEDLGRAHQPAYSPSPGWRRARSRYEDERVEIDAAFTDARRRQGIEAAQETTLKFMEDAGALYAEVARLLRREQCATAQDATAWLRGLQSLLLFGALFHGVPDMVRALGIAGVDVSMEHMEITSLLVTVVDGDIGVLRLLVELGADVNAVSAIAGLGMTALSAAAVNGQAEAIQALCELGANVGQQNEKGDTALHLAASTEHLQVTRVLVRCGAGLQARDEHGFSPLHVAASCGQLEQVQTLLTLGADVGDRARSGQRPLQMAAGKGHARVVRTLVEAGAALEEADNCGWTALHEAAAAGQLETVQELMECGADPQAKSLAGLTPLIGARCPVVRQYLERRRSKLTVEPAHEGKKGPVPAATGSAGLGDQREPRAKLPAAAPASPPSAGAEHGERARSDGPGARSAGGAAGGKQRSGEEATLLLFTHVGIEPEAVRALVEQGADVKARGGRGSPLHHAALDGKPETIRVLVELGADVDAKNEVGNTPLHSAAAGGSIERVRVLVELGADLDSQNVYGDTPLHVAANMDNPDAIRELVTLGADVDAKNTVGDTALHRAAECGAILETIRVLVELEADVDAENEEGNTPLHSAAAGGSDERIRVLVELGADLDSQNVYGDTPLHVAANMDNPDAIRELVTLGADVHAKNESGDTALHRAAKCGAMPETIRVLVELEADVDARNQSGDTALHMAAGVRSKRGCADLVHELADLGADLGARNQSGNTALHVAAITPGGEHTIRELVKLGAKLDVRNHSGKTALEVATLGRKPAKVKELMEAIAVHENRANPVKPPVTDQDALPVDTVASAGVVVANEAMGQGLAEEQVQGARAKKKGRPKPCAWSACGRELPPGMRKKCARCMMVVYCNAECQKAHWESHKTVCKRRCGNASTPD
ncbi:hypothetical protein CYMTET_30104 [Cymbomonas tetramitiformis]|uniref:MYND-type domain-containing protein n=1 Tax=Cymbomonas tetramitiformis TaxID=36881 RepID=A0AAE0FK02_9CHLO|nr:hypothetical protein CYMTET_30104 [Cymbomonas tetramitiformis]